MRFAVNLGILERPLTQGLLWGLVTGDMSTALGIALFFELFWLDQIPVGTYIPPNSLLSMFLALSLAQYFHLDTPGLLVYPLVCAIPMALVASRLEYLQRRWQDAGHNSLLHWQRASGKLEHSLQPERLVLVSLLQQFMMYFALFILGLLSLLALLHFLQAPEVRKMLTLPLSWMHIWFLAAIGGVLALRTKQSYGILALGVGLVALLCVF